MGSYTNIKGEFTLSRPVGSDFLKELHTKTEIYEGFFNLKSNKQPHNSITKGKKLHPTVSSNVICCAAEWKCFYEGELTKLCKDFVAVLASLGMEATGKFRCLHETGDRFGADINGLSLEILQGKVSYDVVEKYTLQPKKEVTVVTEYAWR
jgi:hypothetical protein